MQSRTRVMKKRRTTGTSMWRRYAAFLRTPPELNITWYDRQTGARAWLVINSQRGGAAGGGTRMRLGLDPREVIYLAKAMELKFSISGPAIGGAKTGIDFDPSDPRKADVLQRWYSAIRPILRERYGTGGDLNVDEVLDVIPAFDRLGLLHPQEGVVRGHLRPDDTQYRAIMARMQAGVEAALEQPFAVDGMDLTVADMITGFGVAVSVAQLYSRRGEPLDGVRVMLEGFGNVGAAAGLYLARFGARIVAIRDARQTFVDKDGVDAAGMDELMRLRENKLLPASDSRVHGGLDRGRFWESPADVFVSAAISESITPETLDQLEAAGVGVIACGSNQPFREVKIGSTQVAQAADRRFAVLPDILANCGMARTFSYLMQPHADAGGGTVFNAVEHTIADTLDEVLDRGGDTRSGLLSATLGLALDRIGA
ncbi:MAG TPA: Glu/Leu/Phe/Val dehydrogenase dimerization domain-containing protein [Longimicrobiales bacterium]|nr:Glu/Leu/Phe/Val dehydrogenase dimerization domain-containing protein [Longimicrobiales bacterium]